MPKTPECVINALSNALSIIPMVTKSLQTVHLSKTVPKPRKVHTLLRIYGRAFFKFEEIKLVFMNFERKKWIQLKRVSKGIPSAKIKIFDLRGV
jgi:hypothetical protein